MIQQSATPCGDGQKYKIGRILAPKSVLEELARHHLVSLRPNGLAILTDVGEKFLRRRSAESRESRCKATLNTGLGPFAQQHMDLRVDEINFEGRRCRVTRNMAEGPLGWLCRRRDSAGRALINSDQYEAGEQFRRDFETAALRANVTANYDGVPSEKKRRARPDRLNQREAALSARKRLDGALEAVGPGLSDVLFRVCCHLEGLGEIERHMGWPQRSGKVILVLALDRLADHYQGQMKGGRPKTP